MKFEGQVCFKKIRSVISDNFHLWNRAETQLNKEKKQYCLSKNSESLNQRHNRTYKTKTLRFQKNKMATIKDWNLKTLKKGRFHDKKTFQIGKQKIKKKKNKVTIIIWHCDVKH